MSTDTEFVEQWRPFVGSIANKLQARLDLTGEIDDLMAAGMEGLLSARARFDASRGVKFNTFAYYRVRGAMLDQVRRMAFLPPKAHALLRASEAADSLSEADGEGMAQGTGDRSTADTLQKIDDALGKLTASYVIAAVGQTDVPAEDGPEARAITREASSRVRAALDVLDERERALVSGFYFDGRRFDEVAEELGISKSWASRIHHKALERLRKALEDE